MPIRILIADDIAIMRRRQIRSFLQRVANWGSLWRGHRWTGCYRKDTGTETGSPAMPRMNLENQLWSGPEPVLLRVVAVLLACALPLQPNGLTAEQVPVRHKEGLMHGFLALRTGRQEACGW